MLHSWAYNSRVLVFVLLSLTQTTTKIDAVMYMDTDTLFVDSVESLWAHFKQFNSTQLAGRKTFLCCPCGCLCSLELLQVHHECTISRFKLTDTSWRLHCKSLVCVDCATWVIFFRHPLCNELHSIEVAQKQGSPVIFWPSSSANFVC